MTNTALTSLSTTFLEKENKDPTYSKEKFQLRGLEVPTCRFQLVGLVLVVNALVLYRVSAFLCGNWYLSGWLVSKFPLLFSVVYTHASARGRDLSLPATACSFISCCHVTVTLARSFWKRRFAGRSVQLNCSSCSCRIPHYSVGFLHPLFHIRSWGSQE